MNENLKKPNKFHRIWVPLMLTSLWVAGLAIAFNGITFNSEYLENIPQVWLNIFPIFVFMALSVVVIINDIIRSYPKEAFTDKSIHYLYICFILILIAALVSMVVVSINPNSSWGMSFIILFGACLQFFYNYVPNNLDKYLTVYDSPIEAEGKYYLESLNETDTLEGNG